MISFKMLAQRKLLVISLLAIVALAVYLATKPEPEYGAATVTFKKKGELVQVYVPLNDVASRKGLGGKSVLPEDYGMLWHFNPAATPNFTMRGMWIPLDFIWIRDGKVVELMKNVPTSETGLFQPKELASDLLEVNAGYTARHDVQVGDAVYLSAWEK